ncbi:MAG: uroporphyrinogen decarboxylase family protein, partial [Christensenella sp.]
ADFEIEIARQYAQIGADAIAFYDDWGTQNTLMINPEIWREIFKPVYKRQFEAVHKMDCKVYFHCCGNIKLIIDDLIEIGADVLNLNQPDIFPVSYLEEKYRGKICFNCPVDHQTVAIFGTDKEINDYVDALCEKLGTENGGFFGYIEEYKSVGMSEENYQSIRAAFARQRFVCYNKKD